MPHVKPNTFGTQPGEDEAYELTKTVFDAGVNFFDNAEAYAGGKAEKIMGKVIKRAGWKRSDLVLSTKILGEVVVQMTKVFLASISLRVLILPFNDYRPNTSI